MTDQKIVRERFCNALFGVLDETFEHVHGIYLDRGTSLLETLAEISADEASQPIAARSGSIAAKVDHVRFYLQTLEDYMLGRPVGKIDWAATWQTQRVSAEEWAELQAQLHAAYQRVLGSMRAIEAWEGEDEIGGALAIAVHTAYHLGEIRQALATLKP